MSAEWYVVRPRFGKSHHLERLVGPRSCDIEVYRSPGCKRERRFSRQQDAQIFADKLNAALSQGGGA